MNDARRKGWELRRQKVCAGENMGIGEVGGIAFLVTISMTAMIILFLATRRR